MGYAPLGVTRDAVQMQEKKKELLEVKRYLINNPDCKEYKGMTLEKVNESLQSIDDFDFLP